MSKNNKFNTIPLAVSLFMSWRNLTTKKFRSVLTIIGVSIGIGSIFFLLSFGLGLRNFVTEQLVGNKSIRLIDVTSQNSKVIKLDSLGVERISGLAKIAKMGRSYSLAGKLYYKKSQINIIAYGMDDNYQDLSYLSLDFGRLIKNKDPDSILISRNTAQDMGFDDLHKAVGSSVRLTIPLNYENQVLEKDFKIIGVIDSSYGSEVFFSLNVLDNFKIEQFSQLKLSVKDTEDLPVLRQQIESMGYITSSPIDTIEQVNQIFNYFNATLVGFGLIGMIIAILGMLNTLSVSLIERTGEIGLLISLGGRHRDMKRLFIYEALLLSLIGSIVGMLVAFISGIIANSLINKLVISRGLIEPVNLFYAPIWLFVGLLVFMLITGLAVAQMPARRAAKINPIDSMRHLY